MQMPKYVSGLIVSIYKDRHNFITPIYLIGDGVIKITNKLK